MRERGGGGGGGEVLISLTDRMPNNRAKPERHGKEPGGGKNTTQTAGGWDATRFISLFIRLFFTSEALFCLRRFFTVLASVLKPSLLR